MSAGSIFGSTRGRARRQGFPRMSPRRRGTDAPDADELARDLERAFDLGLEDGFDPELLEEVEASDAGRETWIGVDLARWATAPSSRTWIPLVALALAAALGISALRTDLIRTRYAVADTTAREEALLAEQRELLARRRALRDPTALARLARERGFGPVVAARVLDDPMPGDTQDRPIMPDVAAPPAPAATLVDVVAPAHVEPDGVRP